MAIGEEVTVDAGTKITRKSQKIRVGAWIKYQPIQGDGALLAEVVDVWKNGKGEVVKVVIAEQDETALLDEDYVNVGDVIEVR